MNSRIAIIKINTANNLFNFSLDKKWASLTPSGAAIIVIGVNIASPIKLTYPRLNGTLTPFRTPEIMKPIVPGMAINAPMPDAVPIALWISKLWSFNKGTLRDPPPIPIITEKILLLNHKDVSKYFLEIQLLFSMHHSRKKTAVKQVKVNLNR